MSRLISQILLTILMLPLAGLVYFAVFVMGTEGSQRYFSYYSSSADTFWLLAAGVVTWGFMALYWSLLWRKGVRWTNQRIVLTLLAALGSALISVIAGAAINPVVREGEIAAFFGSTLAPVLWLVATAILWRETPEERRGRLQFSKKGGLVCPICGYNLTGLTETRCPECGARFTLDELIARQPQLEGSELEG